jgi:hypothetical protein
MGWLASLEPMMAGQGRAPAANGSGAAAGFDAKSDPDGSAPRTLLARLMMM